ncbi:MAG: dihydrodipicolinate synthase family protein [Anaerolineae bacterium]|nr:dihydrodipicolinate synthase family protein [Anaerolineae bacterium]
MSESPMPPSGILSLIRRGTVIPAHPLALTEERRLDERHQRALTRYYLAAGAGGVAVAVHTTQFEIREPEFDLLQPVLTLAAEEARAYQQKTGRDVALIAGVVGDTRQAVREAELASRLGYHAVLLSLAALKQADTGTLIQHCRRVAEVMPLFGFYLQPAVGGRVLPYDFWRRFAEIENVIAIKMAPFNRYQTIDVVRGVVEAGRVDEIALYTGNDDHILLDLVTPFPFRVGDRSVVARVVGGLLGQWAVWTRRAVEMHAQARRLAQSGDPIPQDFLGAANELTDANAALFDVAHNYAGCIAGINEVLRRQGLLASRACLNPREDLSPGQAAEITRVQNAYPALIDDDFVAEHLQEWLR